MSYPPPPYPPTSSASIRFSYYTTQLTFESPQCNILLIPPPPTPIQTPTKTVGQGLPRTYNKDLQEDKEPLFDTVSTVHDCLRIAAGVVATMTPNADNLRAQLVPEMLATDLADYLVRKVGWAGEGSWLGRG